MADEPDVRLEGVTHEQILEWVAHGRAGKSTNVLEARMKQVVEALYDAAHKVNGAVQQATTGWEGSAAESATAAMASLRDFDDELHTHGTADRDSAMGQSGESAATRDRVPPIPLHLDAQPTILGSTVDPKARILARREAEDRAREVLAEYQEATRHRLASLPRIAPVPTVVLDTGTDETTPSAGAKAHTEEPAAPVPVPRHASKEIAGTPVAPPVEAGPVQAGPVVVDPVTPAQEAPGTASQAAEVPGSGSLPARGDPPAAGGERPVVVGGGVAPVIGERPGVVETKGGLGGEGPRSGAGPVVERQPGGQREVSGGRTGGSGNSGLLGGVPGTPGDEGEEHHNRYHRPSGEPFEPDDDEDLPDGFILSPDVIGGPE